MVPFSFWMLPCVRVDVCVLMPGIAQPCWEYEGSWSGQNTLRMVEWKVEAAWILADIAEPLRKPTLEPCSSGAVIGAKFPYCLKLF